MLSDEGIMCPFCGFWPMPVVITLEDGPSLGRRIPDTWREGPKSTAVCKREGCGFRMILPKEEP